MLFFLLLSLSCVLGPGLPRPRAATVSHAALVSVAGVRLDGAATSRGPRSSCVPPWVRPRRVRPPHAALGCGRERGRGVSPPAVADGRPRRGRTPTRLQLRPASPPPSQAPPSVRRGSPPPRTNAVTRPPGPRPPLPHLGCRPQGQTTGGCGGCGTTTAAARGVQLMGGNRGDARLEAPPTRSRARRGGGVVAAEPRGSGGRLKPSSGDVARSWCRGCRCQACDATWRRGGGGLPRK